MLESKNATLFRSNVESQLYQDWVKTSLLCVLLGIISFVVGMYFEKLSGQSTVFDAISYPIAAILMGCLALWVLIKPQVLHLAAPVVFFAASSFLISKLAYILFFLPKTADPLHQLTEGFFWVAVVYMLVFLSPNKWLGQVMIASFTFIVLLLSLSYVLFTDRSAYHWGLIYAMTQLNLVNFVSGSLALMIIRLKERYTNAKSGELIANKMVRYDPLTQLPNRFSLEEELKQLFLKKEPFSLLFIDVDNFKGINDSFGHQIGDQLLQDIASRLSQTLREGDMIARLSGDEFVLVSPKEAVQYAERIAERILTTLSTPFLVDDNIIQISVSIGISQYPNNGEDIKTLLQHADLAMYQSKEAGKNTCHIYSQDMNQVLEQKQFLINDLRQAFAKQELELYYQPIFDLQTSRLIKFEALLRWNHAERGFVSPAVFIPLAEESGLIESLGKWVLRQACIAANDWQAYLPGVAVAVNISALQFSAFDFTHSVMATVEKAGLSPENLELEITESVVLKSVDSAIASLNQLKGFGVRIALDDFGTGYSSLLYLQNLPVDTLKIDRSFVNKLTTSKEEASFAIAIIKAIISLSEPLKLSIVAEGIERLEQLESLAEVGCHWGQGYYFSKPVEQVKLFDLFAPTDASAKEGFESLLVS